MKLDQEHIFESEHYPIKLVAKTLDEPHPGHMIWRYEFYREGKLLNDPLLNYKWGGLYPDLDGYSMESDDGAFVYIPTEGSTLIYDTKSKKFKSYTAVIEGSNNTFVTNVFSEGRLLVVFKRSIQIVELKYFTVQNIHFEFNRFQLIAAQYIDDLLIVKYKDLSDYQVYNKRYDFNKMDFEN